MAKAYYIKELANYSFCVYIYTSGTEVSYWNSKLNKWLWAGDKDWFHEKQIKLCKQITKKEVRKYQMISELLR